MKTQKNWRVEVSFRKYVTGRFGRWYIDAYYPTRREAREMAREARNWFYDCKARVRKAK